MEKLDFGVYKNASAAYDNPNALPASAMSDHNAWFEQPEDALEKMKLADETNRALNGKAHQLF